MKLGLYKIGVLVVILQLLSCDGDFIPNPDNYILLQAPIGNCEDGREDDLNDDNIIVNFTWENVGTFDEGELFVFENKEDQLVVQKNVDPSAQKVEASLPRGVEYYWYIESTSSGANETIKSDQKTFVSEFVSNERTPFPVIVSNYVPTPNSFIIEWENHPEETNRDLSYTIYFSARIEKDSNIEYREIVFDQPGIQYNSGDRLTREQPKEGLKAGDYFFKIDAIAKSGGDELISSTYYRVFLLTDN